MRIKREIKRKWIEREYNVKEDADVAHKYVEILCNTNQFPSFQFFSPHKKHMVSKG